MTHPRVWCSVDFVVQFFLGLKIFKPKKNLNHGIYSMLCSALFISTHAHVLLLNCTQNLHLQIRIPRRSRPVPRFRKNAILRTFARKSSNIDFFIKLLLKLENELLLSEMQKNWGLTDFVLEIRYLKGHPNIEKSIFLTRYGSNVCICLKILQMNL